MRGFDTSVSVVITTHDVARFELLARAVRGIERQTIPVAEIFVVVDGSADLAALAEERFAQRVKVIGRPHSGGVSAARNTGTRAAASEYVAFLDDDAEPAPDWLERLLEAVAETRALGASGRVDPEWCGRPPRWLASDLWWALGCTYRGLPETRTTVRNFYGGCALVRRDVFERVGGYRDDLGRHARGAGGGEEAEFCLRAAAQLSDARFVFEPRAVVRHLVPVERTTVGYMLRRSFAEGQSKAVVRHFAPAGRSLVVERGYVLSLFGGGRGSAADGRRSAGARVAIAGAIVTASVGYAIRAAVLRVRREGPARGTPPSRVAMVAARAHPYVGGIESHVTEVSTRLAAKGFEVTVLTSDLGDGSPRGEVRDGVSYERLRAFPRGRDWMFMPALMRAIHADRFDVVHVQGIHTLSAPMGMIAALRSHLPFVVHFHSGGSSSRLRSKLRGMQWRLLAPLVRRADTVIAVSEYEARVLGGAMRLDPTRVRIVRNGVETMPQAPEVESDGTIAGTPLILSVGRLERYKGHHRMITAMAAVRRRHPHATLAVVGSGPYREELAALAGQAPADSVVFRSYPPQQHDELLALMRRADAVVLLSEYEAHPVAVIEAVQCGTPVVVARTSGLTELADAGIVLGVALAASPAEIADAIDRALVFGAPEVVLPTWDDTVLDVLDAYEPVVS